MTEKRKATEALFRQEIDEQLEFMRKPIWEGGAGMHEATIRSCLVFARFAILTLRKLEAEDREAVCGK